MNFTEKRRAERLLDDWLKAHPPKLVDEPKPSPELKKLVEELKRVSNAARDRAFEEGFALTDNVYEGWMLSWHYFKDANNPAHRQWNEENRKKSAELVSKVADLRRRILTGALTFETIYEELDKLEQE